MSTQREKIQEWLERAAPEDHWMLVLCDTFDHSDYPVFYKENEAADLLAMAASPGEMTRVMECYDLRGDLEEQLAMQRAFILPDVEPKVRLRDRQGKIRVTVRMVEEGLLPDLFKEIEFSPMIANLFDYGGQVCYGGFCPHFEPVIEGQAIPEYMLEFRSELQPDGSYKTVFDRMEKL